MSRRQKPALSDLENKVMAALWSQGQATAESIRMALEASQPLKDSTVRTVLRRLEEKGYVERDDDLPVHLFSATIGLAQLLGGIELLLPEWIFGDAESVDAAIKDIQANEGAPTILVNNAGGQFPQAALDFSVKGWNAVIDTNLNGTWYMMYIAFVNSDGGGDGNGD